LEQARRQHAAAHLRAGLAPGEDCPVCGQEVHQLPEATPTPELSEAEQAHQQATHHSQSAQQAEASATARREELARRVAALEETLEDSPGEEAIQAELAAIVEAEAAVEAARQDSGQADQQMRRCERRLEELSEAVKKARRQLQEARDTVAALGPPALELEELAADWQRLLDWAAEVLPRLEEQAAEAASQMEELRARYQSAESDLQERCREAGVEVAGRPLRDAVYEALSDALNAHRRVLEQLQQVEDLRAERQRKTKEATVARDLARHLGAANFEKWVLEEALRLLVAGANERLGHLARGHYSLALDSRLQFEVIDHFAADERRPVKTLSGGETFLVSLALALSLADRVAELSAQGSARLESIFLDEGFGTLDPEALETVASVVTEIGASGKTVGIVTHVKELAELMPVRFEVTKGAGGAAVTRVDQ
jgi:exonuclease SbcC